MPEENLHSHNFARTSVIVGEAVFLVASICACSNWPALTAEFSTCTTIVGNYENKAESSHENLFKALTGMDGKAATVKIVYADDKFSVVAGEATRVLKPANDATCAPSGELIMARQDVDNIRLPPLIDQTITTSYEFSNKSSGDLAMTIYSQTTLRPYGKEIKGPRKIESTAVWRRLPI